MLFRLALLVAVFLSIADWQCASSAAPQTASSPLANFSLADVAVTEQATSAQVHIVTMIQTVEASVAGYGYVHMRMRS